MAYLSVVRVVLGGHRHVGGSPGMDFCILGNLVMLREMSYINLVGRAPRLFEL